MIDVMLAVNNIRGNKKGFVNGLEIVQDGDVLIKLEPASSAGGKYWIELQGSYFALWIIAFEEHMKFPCISRREDTKVYWDIFTMTESAAADLLNWFVQAEKGSWKLIDATPVFRAKWGDRLDIEKGVFSDPWARIKRADRWNEKLRVWGEGLPTPVGGVSDEC